MPIRAGKLDRRITIQQRVGGQDSYGQPTDNWETYKTRWASFEPRSGSEGFEARQSTAKQTAIFEIRYTKGVHPGMRILFDKELWDIEDVAETEKRERLRLTCTAREVLSGPSGVDG